MSPCGARGVFPQYFSTIFLIGLFISMKAALWMSGTIFSFCLMAVAARELSAHLSTMQILAFRSLIGLLVVTLIILWSKKTYLFATVRLPLHIGRNLFHFGGQFGWFLGIGLLPLAEVFALEFTVPFWTVLIAALFLNEKITRRKIGAVALGLIGVLVILKPGKEILDLAALIVLAAAIGYAISHSMTKSLSKTEQPLTILFYMCFIQLWLGVALVGTDWVLPNPMEWLWLLAVGLTALTAHYCIANAMKAAEAGVVVTLDFLRLPLIAVFGVVLYEEPFEISLMMGAGLMLAGNLLNLYKPKS